MIYFSDSKKILKCFECNWESKAKDKKWICEICGKKFQSDLKEYYKYETKPLLNCIKYAIIKKIVVKPYKVDCCNLDPLKISFYHNKTEGCNGKLYLSYLNKRPVIVCSKCKTIKEVPDMVWDCPNCQSKFNCNGIIYIQKKKKKFLGKNINKHHHLNRTGSHNNIYKKEISSNFIIRNKKTFEESFNDTDENSNYYSPSNDNVKIFKKSNKFKKIKNSVNRPKKKNLDFMYSNHNNNSFIEIRNITPQKDILGDFIVNEAGYFTKNHFKGKYDISKENNDFFSNSKKCNSKEITRNNTMINIKSEQNNKILNFKPSKLSQNNTKYQNSEKENEDQNEISSFLEGNKMKLNFGSNLNMNRNNSRQQFEPNMLKNSQLKEEDYIDDKVNSNSVNNNEMKLVKRRLAFMEPTPTIAPEEYEILDKIGYGSFGKIYSVKWGKNGKKYAMKILKLSREKDLENYKNKLNILINFIKKTNCKNVVKVYGTLYEKLEENYKCYVLMELAKTDWEVEIKYRSKHQLFYTEIELINIIKQLIQCYAQLQKCNITHRDVKPQNILVVNDLYKICDFGEAMITHGKNGFIHQPIRGSELYMSPILFDALNSHKRDIIHNTYKSDVFSLGMCIFFAATLTFQSLYDIREIKNMEIIENVVGNYLYPHYSEDIVDILFKMLQIEEKKRPDFIQLERMINF
jgi:Zn finger protein HypA/HybF involved in hydrogenase expression